MTTVVAGLLERDGQILICRRREDQSHAGKWEFPGGKLEHDETEFQTVQRELEEELNIHVWNAEEVMRYQYAYPDGKPLQLVFLRIREFEGTPDTSQFAEIHWEWPHAFSNYDFLEGDEEIVQYLSKGAADF